ncbi:hypothetical protein [Sphingomonas sp. Leaf37]|uniref:hypothetical protein n=1 Tax=Sphingomonas sp. Leaf37 TaxID=2876552 RepID=UPI001E2C2D2F|nr:hypothetical protein [Sphingomonas sp. Leaf37]
MPHIVQEAAASIVSELAPFECAIDVAIARAGRFLASLAEGTIEAQVGPLPIHSAMMNTFATVAALGEVRNGIAATRRELVLTRAKFGMQETAIGSLPGCPPMEAVLTNDTIIA